jgi:hypothetical protein
MIIAIVSVRLSGDFQIQSGVIELVRFQLFGVVHLDDQVCDSRFVAAADAEADGLRQSGARRVFGPSVQDAGGARTGSVMTAIPVLYNLCRIISCR